MIDRLNMEKKAIAFREQNNLSHNKVVRLYDLLDKLCVITVFKGMSEGVSGMATKVDDNRFMLINSNLTLARQNFTIAHELYHLFIQENFKSEICETEKFSRKDREEYLADSFATHLLLPNDGVVSLIPTPQLAKDKIELTTIQDIENHYGCSRRATLYRLKDIGLITDNYMSQFLEDIAKKALANGYPKDLYFPKNEGKFIGADYINVVEDLYARQKIREVDYISYLQDAGISKI